MGGGSGAGGGTVTSCDDEAVPAQDLHSSRCASLGFWPGSELLGGVNDFRGNLRVAVGGEMDVVASGDPFETGQSVFLSVRSVSDAVHDVDDFEVSDAVVVKCFDDGVSLPDVFGECVCGVGV